MGVVALMAAGIALWAGYGTGVSPEARNRWRAVLLGGVTGVIAPACFVVVLFLAALPLTLVVPMLGWIWMAIALLAPSYWWYVLIGGFVVGGVGGWLGYERQTNLPGEHADALT
jgi:hypothetical protein